MWISLLVIKCWGNPQNKRGMWRERIGDQGAKWQFLIERSWNFGRVWSVVTESWRRWSGLSPVVWGATGQWIWCSVLSSWWLIMMAAEASYLRSLLGKVHHAVSICWVPSKFLLVFTPVCSCTQIWTFLKHSRGACWVNYLPQENGGLEELQKSLKRESHPFILMSYIIGGSIIFSAMSLTHKVQMWPLIRKVWNWGHAQK